MLGGEEDDAPHPPDVFRLREKMLVEPFAEQLEEPRCGLFVNDVERHAREMLFLDHVVQQLTIEELPATWVRRRLCDRTAIRARLARHVQVRLDQTWQRRSGLIGEQSLLVLKAKRPGAHLPLGDLRN